MSNRIPPSPLSVPVSARAQWRPPASRAPERVPSASLYACLYKPPSREAVVEEGTLAEIAEQCSPRYELHGDDLVSLDIRGLDRVLGSPRAIGEQLRRDAAVRNIRVHVAVATSRTTAMLLARARPGLTVVNAGEEAAALAPVPLRILLRVADRERLSTVGVPAKVMVPAARGVKAVVPAADALRKDDAGWESALSVIEHWGIRTLGEFAALPSSELAARLGAQGAAWQALARGEETRPLVPARPDERFEASIDLEWPIEGLEPLSFVLTRLLEPLSTRLERCDRGVAVLRVALGLVTREVQTRRLELPSPIREVRALRTLAMLDLEAHPPAAGIDRVTITIDPTPGRIWQYTLFARPHPTPEQLSTLLARLGALMGQDRIGAATTVDSYRPGAFAMRPFALEHDAHRIAHQSMPPLRPQPLSVQPLVSALRRCRHPVPARVATDAARRPVRVTTARQGLEGGAVTASAGPWRTSGEWWASAPALQEAQRLRPSESEDMEIRRRGSASVRAGGGAPAPVKEEAHLRPFWDRDEWEVALADGAVYRIFQDRTTQGWFIDAVID